MTKVLTPLFVHQEGVDLSLGKQTHQVMEVSETLGTVELRNIHTQIVHRVPNDREHFRMDTLVSDVQLVQRPTDDAWGKSHIDAVSELNHLRVIARIKSQLAE